MPAVREDGNGLERQEGSVRGSGGSLDRENGRRPLPSPPPRGSISQEQLVPPGCNIILHRVGKPGAAGFTRVGK